MFDENRISELASKNILRKNSLNVENYRLIIDDSIETEYINFEISLWKDGIITFRDILDIDKCNGELCNNKITGKGSQIYREDIKEAIRKFNEKYKEVIDYITIK